MGPGKMGHPIFEKKKFFDSFGYSLMNHSCFHNAKTCFTEDLKTVVYALQPIKKNSQIFISYSASFYFFPLQERQAMLKKYNFDCNCEACQACWPPLCIMTTEELVQQNYLWKSSIEQKIYFDCLDIFTAIKSRNTLDKNVIEKISKNLIQARALEQPSLITSMLMEALHATFTSIQVHRITMEREKKAFLREFKKLGRDFVNSIYLKKGDARAVSKSSEASEAFRKDGNALFLQKSHNAQIHKKIFNYYCQSVMTAPNSSDHLACAYGNRSAFLLHIKQYEDCIKDCNRALKLTKSKIIKAKMLCRKAECLKKLKLPEFQNVLEEAETIRNKIENDEQSEKIITETLNKVKNLTISNKSHAKNQTMNPIKLNESFDGIKIEYTEKYGRHLIATRDYKPGDIILVENQFAPIISGDVRHTNCHYCLKICWSGVPCKNCNWAIFCSEDCRLKAWKSFHDIECSCTSFFKLLEKWPASDVAVRAIIISIKQAGSVGQLRANLKSITENSAGDYSKGFIKDGEYTKNRIESIFIVDTNTIPDGFLRSMVPCALIIIIGIVQNSTLFGNVDSNNVYNFMQSKDVIFLGSLIMKILAVNAFNDGSFASTQLQASETSNSLSQNGKCSCCVIGFGFTPITSLLSHSCFPNANRCYSEDRQVILYAVQPINTNSQIFESYTAEFYNMPIAERKLSLKQYDLICDCKACIESWPPILELSEEILENNYSIKGALQNKIYDQCSHIFDALNEKKINYSTKDIKTLSKAIVQAGKLKQPTLLMCYLFQSIKRVFAHVYGLKQHLDSFGRCN